MEHAEVQTPDESAEYWTDERCFILELSNDGEDAEVSIAQSIANTGDDDLVFLCICTPRFQWPNYESLE